MTESKNTNYEKFLIPEDETIAAMENELLNSIVKLREEKGLSQVQLARLCNMKQPVISRMENSIHSPQITSLLRVLIPLGYKLQIVSLDEFEEH